jgi:hypothetical protein
MATKKTKKTKVTPIEVVTLTGAVKAEQPTIPPVTITLPGEIAEAAQLESDYQVTVTVGMDNIKAFLAGASVREKNDGFVYREDGQMMGAILLTF